MRHVFNFDGGDTKRVLDWCFAWLRPRGRRDLAHTENISAILTPGGAQQDRPSGMQEVTMAVSFTRTDYSTGNYPTGDSPVVLAVADLNGNGAPDLVTANDR